MAIHIDFYQLEFEKFYFSTKISFTDKILSAVKSRKNHWHWQELLHRNIEIGRMEICKLSCRSESSNIENSPDWGRNCGGWWWWLDRGLQSADAAETRGWRRLQHCLQCCAAYPPGVQCWRREEESTGVGSLTRGCGGRAGGWTAGPEIKQIFKLRLKYFWQHLLKMFLVDRVYSSSSSMPQKVINGQQ